MMPIPTATQTSPNPYCGEVTTSLSAAYAENIERKPGDDTMSGYHHPDNMLAMGKAKMQRYHQEQEAFRLARSVRPVRSEQIKAAVNKVISFFKSPLSKKDRPQPQACVNTATESM